MQCVITGCDAVTPDGWVYVGDLFQIGDVYVFNATVDHRAKPIPQQRPPHPKHISFGPHYWDRRGVLVDNAFEAQLSAEAQAYVAKSKAGIDTIF